MQFVGSVGFLLLLQRFPHSLVEAAFAQPQPLRFFDEHGAAVVTEATARLIPGPEDDPDEAATRARARRASSTTST